MKPVKTVASFWQEFKAFAFKGNMIDLAVAVVIGGAFGKIITAIVADLIMPLVAIATIKLHIPADYQTWKWHGFLIGDFLSEIVQFLIISAVIFIIIVKMLGSIMKVAAKPAAPSEPTTRECPMCLSIIPLKARKCAHCTSDLTVLP